MCFCSDATEETLGYPKKIVRSMILYSNNIVQACVQYVLSCKLYVPNLFFLKPK